MSVSMASSEHKPEYDSVNEPALLKPARERRYRILTIVLVAAALGIVCVAGGVFGPAKTPVTPSKQMSVVLPPSQIILDDTAKTALGKLAQCRAKYVVLVVSKMVPLRSGAYRVTVTASKAPASSACGMTISEVTTMLETDYPNQRVVVATSLKCDASANVLKKVSIIWAVSTPQQRVDTSQANGEVGYYILDNSINGFQAQVVLGASFASQLDRKAIMNLGCTTTAPVPSPTANPITYTRANSVKMIRSYNQNCDGVCRTDGKYAVESDTGLSMCSASASPGLIVTGYQKDGEKTCMVGRPASLPQASTTFSCLCSSDLPGFAFGKYPIQLKDCAAKCDTYRRRAVETAVFRGTKIYSCVGVGMGLMKGGYNLAGQDTCYIEARLNKVTGLTRFGCLCQ